MIRKSRNILFWIPVILLAGILFSCENDLDTIQRVTFDPKAPDNVSENLEVYHSDSGYARVKIFAKIAENYDAPEHVTKFKDYIKVQFYSDKGVVISELEAKYGEINHETNLMVVRDSVILRNLEKGRYLETEELFYNQNDSIVYTDKFVIIKREDKSVVGRGNGIRTSHLFNSGQVAGHILKPIGKLDFSED